jgi:hypothetical protein
MYKIITEKEAIERFQLFDYILGSYGDDTKFLVLEGDVNISDDINLYNLCSPVNTYGLIIDGNLTLTGILYQPDMDFGETLFVTGDLRAKSINKGGAEFYIKGNLIVEQTIYGYYNHGSLTVEGNTKATTIFAEDHYFKFGGDVQGVVINTGHMEGAPVDFTTTEPLLDELISNEHYSHKGKLNQYINEGRHIVKDQYVEGEKQREQPRPVATTSITPQLISGEEAKQRFNLDDYEGFDEGFEKVILFDGDTHFNGDLTFRWTEKALTALGADSDLYGVLILVNGNLTVAGTICPAGDSFPY